MNKRKHYQHQLKYFEKEFAGMQEYKLEAWQKSYINRIKKYVIDKEISNKTLIDIASGSGYVAIEMAKLGLKVIATDLSPQSVKNLQKFKKEFKLKNLEIIECKAEKIPLKNNSVDYLVANAILEHIPEEKKTINEWKRLMKPKGKMFITVPLKFRYVWPFLWPLNYMHDRRIGHLRRYDKKDLEEKFGLPITKYFYTGHLVKVIGLGMGILTKSDKYSKSFERRDDKKSHKRYGANNISVVFANTRR